MQSARELQQLDNWSVNPEILEFVYVGDAGISVLLVFYRFPYAQEI
jgi:hypothetical protein